MSDEEGDEGNGTTTTRRTRISERSPVVSERRGWPNGSDGQHSSENFVDRSDSTPTTGRTESRISKSGSFWTRFIRIVERSGRFGNVALYETNLDVAALDMCGWSAEPQIASESGATSPNKHTNTSPPRRSQMPLSGVERPATNNFAEVAA